MQQPIACTSMTSSDISQCKEEFTPKLATHPDSIKHETIPTAAFCAPITMHNSAETSIYHASMGWLLRALYDHVDPTSNANASVKATIWTWWRKAKTERSLPNKMVGLYKYLTGPSSHAVVKNELLQELCQTINHPMLTSVTQYPCIGNCSIIPKATLVEGLNLTKELINDYHNVQITAPIPNPVLQAISQKNLWEKLKILCPKGQFYTGPIFDNHGHKCTTAAEYDEAMLATRQFWFTPPVPGGTAWNFTLSTYQQHSQPWPTIPTPQLNDYYLRSINGWCHGWYTFRTYQAFISSGSDYAQSLPRTTECSLSGTGSFRLSVTACGTLPRPCQSF